MTALDRAPHAAATLRPGGRPYMTSLDDTPSEPDQVEVVHTITSGGIKHPGRHHDDLAGNHLYMNDVAAGAALHVLTPKSPFIKRVPAIVDFNHLPDMGRMTR